MWVISGFVGNSGQNVNARKNPAVSPVAHLSDNTLLGQTLQKQKLLKDLRQGYDMPEHLDRETISALGAETRQTMIKALERRPYTASELAKALGKHVTTVTEHLHVLEKSGLVQRKEDGHKWIYYVLSDKGSKLLKPKFYSWTILLSLSVVAIFVSGFFIGSVQSFAGANQAAVPLAQAAAPLAGTADKEALVSGAPAAGFVISAEIYAAALILMAIGVLGVSLALAHIKKTWAEKQP